MTKKPKEEGLMKSTVVNVDKKTKRKKGKIFKKILYFLMILTFFVVGIGLMFHQSITNKIVEDYSTSYVDNTKPEDMLANEDADVSFDPSNVGALTSTDVLSEMTSDNHYTDLPVIGAMAVPELGMNLPIIKGLDNASLAIGAGTMKDGQKMGKGNYALASHSLFYGWGYEDLLFSPLRRAQKGMTIYTRDSENIYTYNIIDVFIVDPDAGYVAFDSEGDGLITLITCTDTYATQRIVVRGKIQKSEKIKDAPSEIRDYFGKDWTRWW